MSAGTDRLPAHSSRCLAASRMVDSGQLHAEVSSRMFSISTLVAACGTNVSVRTPDETTRDATIVACRSRVKLSQRRSRLPAENLSPNDADRIMQSRPRRQMEKERATGVLGEFKLDPCVESVQMDANNARRPETIAGGERSLIERGEPAVRHSHLVVQSE
jgi:hypothetical protein